MRLERLRWDGHDPERLARTLRGGAPALGEVSAAVAEILASVRDGGDAVVRELESRFGSGEAPSELRVDPTEIARARGAIPSEALEALEHAAASVTRVAEAQLRGEVPVVEFEGYRVAIHERPVGAAGIYAPGGRAAYPSSVLMCALPARVAGVRRVALASPPAGEGRPHPLVLAACSVAGVDEVYAMGGAQAVAALAYGTESIPPVDLIAGPGNRYVTEAKRQLVGTVGIDGLAGPSELAIVADGDVEPRWLALDLLAQAEHGPESPLFLLGSSEQSLGEIAELVLEMAGERPSVADARLVVVQAPDGEAALRLADAIAPEHLQLAARDPERELPAAYCAGCVLVGSYAATAFGDYAAGSNHVLPTGGAARFGGPLGPRSFMRRTSVVSIGAKGARRLAPTVQALSAAEGLPVHGESAVARAGENERP